MIAPSFYPVHGGAGLRFYRYLPHFHKSGIETTVICGTPKEKKFTDQDRQAEWCDYQDGKLVLEENLEFAKILKFKIPGSGSALRSKILLEKAIELCTEKNTKPDIVHVIAPMPFHVICLINKIKKLGVRLLFSHTIAKKYSHNFFSRALTKWKDRRVLQKYDVVFVQSSMQAELLLKIQPGLNIIIAPNGVDTEKFSPVNSQEEKDQLRETLDLPVGAKIITSVGAIHPRKGTDLLIEAWAKVVSKYPYLNLVLLGPRYDLSRTELSAFKEKINQSINQSNMSENIHLLGAVDNVEAYLKASDMFVFASEREGMPNAVIEAMSVSLPIVLTPFIGLSKEMGLAGKHFLLAERSSDSLVEHIVTLMNDGTLCTQLAANGRKWILTNMTIKQSANQHSDVYLSCISS